jgi:hypothetical protein
MNKPEKIIKPAKKRVRKDMINPLSIPDVTSASFVDKEEFLAQRFKKLVAETAIKNEQKDIERIKKEKLLGLLIETTIAEEAFQIMGSKVKARLNRLVYEIPPKLEGLTAQQMIDALRVVINGVLNDLCNELKDFIPTEVEQ